MAAGQRVGQTELEENLRGRCVVHEKKVDQVFVDADESLGCVGDDGSKADDKCDDGDGEDPCSHPENDERRDGDDGNGLQQDCVGKEHLPEPPTLGEDHGDADADDDAGYEPARGFFGSDEERTEKRRQPIMKRCGNNKRAGQDVGRQMIEADQKLPYPNEAKQNDDAVEREQA